MDNNLRDIISAAICKFNIEIDDKNNFAASISPDACPQTCDYCRLFAEYICRQICEDHNDKEQSTGSPSH